MYRKEYNYNVYILFYVEKVNVFRRRVEVDYSMSIKLFKIQKIF